MEIKDVVAPLLGAALGGSIGGKLTRRLGPRAGLAGAAIGTGLGILQNEMLGDNRGVAPAVLAAGGGYLAASSAYNKIPRVAKVFAPLYRQKLLAALGGIGALGALAGTAVGGGINETARGHGGGMALGALASIPIGRRAGINPIYSTMGGMAIGNLGSRFLESGEKS